MKRFIVLTTAATSEEQVALTDYFIEFGWGCWHWMPDVWLLSEVPDTYDPMTLFYKILNDGRIKNNPPLQSICKMDRSMLFLQIDGKAPFAGQVPEGAWDWFFKNWGSPDGGPAPAGMP